MSYFKELYSSDLPSRAIMVYMYLKDRSNQNNACWPSHRLIAEETGLSKATVKRAIADLKNAGFIITEQRWREKGGKSSLLYSLK